MNPELVEIVLFTGVYSSTAHIPIDFLFYRKLPTNTAADGSWDAANTNGSVSAYLGLYSCFEGRDKIISHISCCLPCCSSNMTLQCIAAGCRVLAISSSSGFQCWRFLLHCSTHLSGWSVAAVTSCVYFERMGGVAVTWLLLLLLPVAL